MIFYDSVSSGASLSARPRSKKVSRNRYLLFLYLWRKFTCRRRCGNKRCRRAAFCAVGLQGPLRRAEGKGVKRSSRRLRSSQSLPLRSSLLDDGGIKNKGRGTSGLRGIRGTSGDSAWVLTSRWVRPSRLLLTLPPLLPLLPLRPLGL